MNKFKPLRGTCVLTGIKTEDTMHPEQKEFTARVKRQYPQHFKNINVVDFGSLNINGSNKVLFEDCNYVGVDIGAGVGVDVICKAHMYIANGLQDTIISTEMLEHDVHWKESVQNMIDSLRVGGLLVITCATTGRKEHGTRRTTPRDSPFTLDYYHNIERKEFKDVVEKYFESYALETYPERGDLNFYGIRNSVV